jgi:hypothetical protein
MERKLSETYAIRSALDCVYAGPYMEPDAGTKSHCPPDKPCQRCLLERERDEAQARCREAAQTLIAAIGASEPEDVEITARRAAQRIAELEAAAEAAESALEFYREPTGYRLLWDPDDEAPPVIADEGATARDALKALRAALGKEADRG